MTNLEQLRHHLLKKRNDLPEALPPALDSLPTSDLPVLDELFALYATQRAAGQPTFAYANYRFRSSLPDIKRLRPLCFRVTKGNYQLRQLPTYRLVPHEQLRADVRQVLSAGFTYGT